MHEATATIGRTLTCRLIGSLIAACILEFALFLMVRMERDLLLDDYITGADCKNIDILS